MKLIRYDLVILAVNFCANSTFRIQMPFAFQVQFVLGIKLRVETG